MRAEGPRLLGSQRFPALIACILGSTLLPVCANSQPINDNFENRLSLEGADVTVVGETDDATAQEDELAHGGLAASTSVWWQWVAPRTSRFGLLLDPITPYPQAAFLAAVNVGTELSSLRELAVQDGPGLTGFDAINATPYQIVVDSGHSSWTGEFTLRIVEVATNDSFASRGMLSGFPVSVEGDNRFATAETGAATDPIGSLPASVWWTWRAPISGRIGISAGVPFQKHVTVFVGEALSNLLTVARQEFDPLVPLDVVAGTDYQILITEGPLGGVGDVFTLQLLQLAENDSFESPFVIGTESDMIEGSTELSVFETGEPVYGNGGRVGSVWYSWTPTRSGLVWMMARSSTFTPEFYVYSGSSISNLTALAAFNSSSPAAVLLQATAGTTYHIAITGRLRGKFRFGIFQPPTNDAFSDRLPLQGTSVLTNGWITGATVESFELNEGIPSNSGTVWYSWIAPANGTAFLTISNAPDPVSATVFRGNSSDVLVKVPSLSVLPWDPIRFETSAGTEYSIRVAGAVTSPAGLFDLQLHLFSSPSNDFFRSREMITGSSAVVNGWNFHASRERGEPRYAGQRTGHSVWWTWTAPATGWARLDGSYSDIPLLLTVYSGSSLRRLRRVAANWEIIRLDPEVSIPRKVEFRAIEGTTYQFVIDTALGRFLAPETGRIQLALDLTALQIITPTNGTVFEEPANVSLIVGESSLVTDGPLEQVYFYRKGQYGNEFFLGQTAGPPFRFTLTNATPGSWIVFARATNGSGRMRETPLQSFIVRPRNDAFQNRITLTGYQPGATGFVSGSTWERREPRLAGAPNGGSIWWSWTAPATGTAHLHASFGDTIAVYSGIALRRLRRVAQVNEQGNTEFLARAGENYAIAAVTANSLLGLVGNEVSFDLDFASVRLASPRDGDAFTEPAQIPLMVTTTEASNNVVRVDYYANGVLVGSSSQPPFSATWSNALAWEYELKAVATLASGAVSITPLIGIFVHPGNDDFVNAFAVSGADVVIQGTNVAASVEAGEPGYASHTVWWKWTAPTHGRVIIPRTNTYPGLQLRCFKGTSITNLTQLVDTNLTQAIKFQFLLTFSVEEGETYYLRADTPPYPGPGVIGFTFRFFSHPANDNFADAFVLSGNNLLFAITNFGATVEPGEPPHGSLREGHSVWYTWTAPAAGYVNLSKPGPYNETVAGVYTGSVLSELKLVAEIPANFHSVGFPVSDGEAYKIAFSDFGEGIGSVGLLTLTTAAANDSFSNASVIDLPFGRPSRTLFGSTVAATKEDGEPDHAGQVGGHSVWWAWKPWASTWVAIDVSPSTPFTPVVAVYVGNSLASLVPVTAGTNGVIFSASSNVTYRIAIDGLDGGQGNYRLIPYVGARGFTAASELRAPAQIQPHLLIRQVFEGGVPGTSRFVLTVSGLPGQRFTLQSSSDLQTWYDLPNEVTVDSGEYIDAPTSEMGSRFYRAVAVP